MSIARAEPDERAKLRLWVRMLRTTRSVERVLRERLAEAFGTTLPRFDVMAALDRAPDGMTMSELSRHLLVSNGNVTGIVERLVADGMITRAARDGDRRAAIVRLTPAGRTAFAAMAAANARWIDELLGEIPVADAERMTATLGSLRRRWEDRT